MIANLSVFLSFQMFTLLLLKNQVILQLLDQKIILIAWISLINLPPAFIQDFMEVFSPSRIIISSASVSLSTSIPSNSFIG